MLIAGLHDFGPDLRLAGWVLIGRIGSVSPTSGEFANIESITAVVIGGISLFGGRGSILGMIFGALIVGVFSLGLRLLGTDPQWTYFLIGVLIIGAVAIDQWIRKVSAKHDGQVKQPIPHRPRPGQALWPGHRARTMRISISTRAKSSP